MKSINTLAAMEALRRNLEQSAQGEFRIQQVCPRDQTDKARGFMVHTDRDQVNKQQNFDQGIYMFPPAYNALRRELYENWQDTLWPMVAWRMAHRAEEFTEYMNAATGLALAVDSDCVDWTCEQYLIRLKKMRGLSGN
jgi:hypothetical protein